MVQFIDDGFGTPIADGHGHDEQVLRDGLAVALQDSTTAAARGVAVPQATTAENQAALAELAEAWYSEEFGYGHDCSLHQDVDQSLWSPGCGTFRPVTLARKVPPPPTVERVAQPPQEVPADVKPADGGGIQPAVSP